MTSAPFSPAVLRQVMRERVAGHLLGEIEAAREILGDELLGAILIDAYGLLDIEDATARFVAWYLDNMRR